MNNLFVSYEIALQLKEKGFDEPYLAYYRGWVEEWNESINSYEKVKELHITRDVSGWNTEVIQAPLYQQVIDWFRDKHEIYISVFIQFEPEVEDEQEEAIIHIYEILNLKEMRKADQSYLPYIETHNFFENSTVNEHYASLKEAIEEALKLI